MRSLILLLVVIILMFCAVVWVDTLGVSDESIKKGIKEKVANSSKLKGVKVKVAVEDGKVVLYGTVVLYIQKMLYEQFVWKTAGVVEVDNGIKVVPRLPRADSVIERKIMEIVHTHTDRHYTGIMLEVEKGTVSIEGTIEHPRDVLFLRHRVAEIEGVIAINLHTDFMN